MSEHISYIYDGNIIKKIISEDILNSEGLPTGYFKQKSEEIETLLGAYLDNTRNYNKFKIDLENFVGRQYNCLFTDLKEKIYFMGKFSSGTPYQNISSQFSAVIDIIKTLGFVNHPYEFNYEATPPRIEITVTPRDGQSDPFKMYFIPLDSYCYKLPV